MIRFAGALFAVVLLLSSSHAALIVQSGPKLHVEQSVDYDASFAARATAAGVLYATNFSDVYLDSVLDATRSGIDSDAELRAEAFEVSGTTTAVVRDATIKLSGSGSLRLDTYDTSTTQAGSWAFRPNGRDDTLYTRLYVQFAIYLPRETVAYRFSESGDSYLKFCNFGQFGSGQVVVGMTRFSGFISLLLNGSGTHGDALHAVSSGSNPWGLTTSRDNPVIGDGVSLTSSDTKALWLNTYGPLPRALQLDPSDTDYDYNAADPYLDERAANVFGWPDSRAVASGAIPWQHDGWTTVEAFLEYNGVGAVSSIQLWAAPYGDAPTMLVNDIGIVDLGDANGDATPNAWDRFELLNYATGRLAEAGIRPTQRTYYSDVIVSTAPINFPGGYEPPSNLGANAPSFAGSMTIGTWYAIDGASPDLGLAATNLASDVDPDADRNAPYTGNSGYRSKWQAWNSGAYAPDVGTYGSMLHWGGGHNDYYGNDISRLDIATRTWSLMAQPSEAGPFGDGELLTNGAYIDSTPSPPHTYTFLQYDIARSRLVNLKSIREVGGTTSQSSDARAWMWDVGLSAWVQGAYTAAISSPSGGFAAYDKTRNVFWTCDHAGFDFGQFDPSTDNGDGTFGTWATYAVSQTANSGSGMGYDPDTDYLLILDGTAGNLYRKDPDNMTGARVTVTQTGRPTTSFQMAFDYSQVLGGFVVQFASSGDVYLLTTADGWTSATWTLLTVSTNAKTFTTSNGLFGRARVLEYGDVVLWVASLDYNTPTLMMRLQ